MAYTILNENGNSLRNLPAGTWNNEGKNAGKEVKPWTFADKNVVDDKPVATLLNAIQLLEAKGFKNLQIFRLLDSPTRVQKQASVTVSNRPVQEIESVSDQDVDPEMLFKNLNSKCLTCAKDCKQSSVVKILRCPQFEKKVA